MKAPELPPGPSLGWVVLDWMTEYLPAPNDQTKPFVLTDEQAALVLWWYALDVDGEFVYRRGCLEMAKGWGKSPLAGAISLAELAGPVLPSGTDAQGEPVGRPWGTGDSPPPWVQIAAVSEDQTDNTYNALYEMLTANEHKAAVELGIDEGLTRLFLKGRPGRLEPVTAASGSREGQRVTFAVLDETHLWTRQNKGVRLAGTLRRNAAKMDGRTFETTNAPALGEKSVAEQTGIDAKAEGIYYVCRRAPQEPGSDWTDEQMAEALTAAYGGATWIDQARILAEIRDPATNWQDALRYYFNLRVAASGKAVDPRRWDELAHPREVPPGSYIALGFDGSISQDATFLRGCTPDGYAFTIGEWVRPLGPAGEGWKVPRGAVHEALARAFETYHVGLMYADPPKWWTEIEGWARQYGEEVVLAFDTNSERRFAPAVDRWLTGIREGTHTHDGDTVCSEHVKAANLKQSRVRDSEDDARTLYVITKGEDGRKIDGAVADVLAYHAAMMMPEEPKEAEILIAWE